MGSWKTGAIGFAIGRTSGEFVLGNSLRAMSAGPGGGRVNESTCTDGRSSDGGGLFAWAGRRTGGPAGSGTITLLCLAFLSRIRSSSIDRCLSIGVKVGGGRFGGGFLSGMGPLDDSRVGRAVLAGALLKGTGTLPSLIARCNSAGGPLCLTV